MDHLCATGNRGPQAAQRAQGKDQRFPRDRALRPVSHAEAMLESARVVDEPLLHRGIPLVAQPLSVGPDRRSALDLPLVFPEPVAFEFQPPSPPAVLGRGEEAAPVELRGPLLAWVARLPAALDRLERVPPCLVCLADVLPVGFRQSIGHLVGRSEVLHSLPPGTINGRPLSLRPSWMKKGTARLAQCAEFTALKAACVPAAFFRKATLCDKFKGGSPVLLAWQRYASKQFLLGVCIPWLRQRAGARCHDQCSGKRMKFPTGSSIKKFRHLIRRQHRRHSVICNRTTGEGVPEILKTSPRGDVLPLLEAQVRPLMRLTPAQFRSGG